MRGQYRHWRGLAPPPKTAYKPGMSEHQTAAELIQQGLVHHRAGQISLAMDRYTQVLRNDPQNADALYYIATDAGGDHVALEDLAVTAKGATPSWMRAPPASNRPMIGQRARMAMSCALMIFCACVSDSEPPKTVKSLEKR